MRANPPKLRAQVLLGDRPDWWRYDRDDYGPVEEGDPAYGAPDVDLIDVYLQVIEVRRVKPWREHVTEMGTLATISKSRLDYVALLAMDKQGLLDGVLDVIRSEEAFVRQMSEGAHSETLTCGRSLARGTSRHMLRHVSV